jgi:hypothetical protein
MAKYGYTCTCGWRLNRTGTRRGYAWEKEKHAATCKALSEELKRSGKSV